MADISELEVALSNANTLANAQYQSAVKTAEATVQAHVQAAQIAGRAQVDVARIVSTWQEAVSKDQLEAAKLTAQSHKDATTYTADRGLDGEHVRSDTEKYGIDQQYKIQTDVERIRVENQLEVSRIEANATTTSALYHAQATVDASANAAQADEYVADVSAQAQRDVATTSGSFGVQEEQVRSDASRDVATITTGNQVSVARIDADSRTSSATISGQFQVNTANAEGGWRETVATTEAGAANYRADQELVGVETHETAETARLEIKLGFARSIYDDVKPIIEEIVGAGVSFLENFGDGGGTGSLGPFQAPYLAVRGVLTPGDIQRQVNTAYARNDARTQGQIRQAQGDLAGRGFSSNSPILDALKVGYTAANLRASVEAASQIRLNAAQANVDAIFRAQEARVEAFLKQEGVLVDAEGVAVQRQVGILGAVSSLVGGIV